MWKLSKLEIKGFKSFAEASRLEFPEGITAVVGPNGCGKSNISDAILWVLGEQSTRALRAQRMQDVIFQGSATRRATGLAEVTLRLSNGHGNGNGTLPLSGADLGPIGAAGGEALTEEAGNGRPLSGDAGRIEPPGGNGVAPATAVACPEVIEDELVITRRLYRSGDSEYLLDGNRCRLRDIRERLAGTGLGTRTCFTIGQGNIDQILSASSMERRAPLEEAAGITLYRQRRHLSELKLEATAQDLARIEDICAEVGRQMRSLKRQAGRAKRYKKLRARLRRLELAWLGRALVEARQRLELANTAAAGARAAELEWRRRLERAAEALAAARRQLEESRRAEQTRRHGLYQSQLEHERLKAEAYRQRDRLAFAEQRITELGRRLEEIEERRAEALSLHARRQAAAREAEAASTSAEQSLSAAEDRLEAVRRRAAARHGEAAEAEVRPLATLIAVEDRYLPALQMALGSLLEADVLPNERLDGWLEEVLESDAVTTALQPGGAADGLPAPADRRLAGPLREKVQGRTETARAVVAVLLRDTWLVHRDADAPQLAREYPGHAFVDLAGTTWACGVEVRARGRDLAAASRALSATASATASRAEDERDAEAADETEEILSPEEIAAREARQRAATARRAAVAQAEASRQEVAVSEAFSRRLETEGERVRAELADLRVAAEESGRRVSDAETKAAEAAERSRALEAELEGTETDDAAADARVRGLEAAQAKLQRDLEPVRERRSEHQVAAAEARAACQHLEGQVRERLGLEPGELLAGKRSAAEEADEAAAKAGREADASDQESDAMANGSAAAGRESAAAAGQAGDDDDAALDARALRQEITEVQAAIDRLGPVNLVAYEDFQEHEARHKDLDTQRRDLREAADNLREAIRRIDEDCVQRFADAFEAINGYFNRIFRQLFGGGRAGMRLEDPDDPLNSGIEIFAQPPGKKLQSIRLLSGGERSLVALALLFAIFEYRPAAFCILDEADAALDENNVDRFLRALHHFEERTQFILITHNKRTMEIADLLYGVTMQESGVSKLVSVQLN